MNTYSGNNSGFSFDGLNNNPINPQQFNTASMNISMKKNTSNTPEQNATTITNNNAAEDLI